MARDSRDEVLANVDDETLRRGGPRRPCVDAMSRDDATFWNKIAERYSARAVPDPAAFERKIAITVGMMEPAHTVLDIGCGTGSLALRLAPHGAEIHGLDISREMIRIAREKAAAAKVDNVVFHVAPFDARFDAFAPASLDGICAYSILHLMDLEQREASLARIHELLVPGGFFISSTLCLGESWVPYGALIRVMRWFGKAPRTVAEIKKEALDAEIRAAGFVELASPDVGAQASVAFRTARKPLSCE